MTGVRFDGIWVPVFPGEGAREVRLLARNGLSLSGWLGAPLALLVPARSCEKVRRWLRPFPPRARAIIPVEGEFARGVLGRFTPEMSGLVLLGSDRVGVLGLSQGLSAGKAALVGHCPLPLWILPAGMRMRHEPRSILVPMSGEKRASEALGMGIQLGNKLGIPVDLLHVTSSRPKRERDQSVVGHLADQFHHEYPGRVEELITEGSPYSSLRERQVIRSFCHCYGDVTTELRQRISGDGDSLLIFEWKGSLEKGHAPKIKILLRKARGPILLLRESGRPRSHLRIGLRAWAAR